MVWGIPGDIAMNSSLPRLLVLWAALAVACSGGGAPPSTVSAPPAGESPAAAPGQINGAGAAFPSPLYSKWFDEYHKLHADVRINYQPIGSGGGIRQLINQTVFFGATDSPVTDEQLKSAPGPIVHLPTVLGGVVPVYNVPGVSAELRFSGPLLADVFLGRITTFNPSDVLAGGDSNLAYVTWNAVWRLSLTATPAPLTLGSTTLTAATNRDVGPTPFFIFIFREDGADHGAGTLLNRCAFGTTCVATDFPNVSPRTNYVAFVAPFSFGPPPLGGIVASSNIVHVTRLILFGAEQPTPSPSPVPEVRK